jgi:dTDP-4-dehydrorhamnose 3,5-epimerase-like enzyme
VNIRIDNCPSFQDDRGSLIQFVTKQTLEDYGESFGQVYLLTFSSKNVIRGNHYHNHSSEMFCLITGSVQMVFEDVETKERITKTIAADGEHYARIYIGSKIAHGIQSLSDFAVLVSFSSEEFDKKNQDKIPYSVIEAAKAI